MQVHAFDPTINVTEGRVIFNAVKKDIFFHKWAMYSVTRNDLKTGNSNDVQGVTLKEATVRYIFILHKFLQIVLL